MRDGGKATPTGYTKTDGFGLVERYLDKRVALDRLDALRRRIARGDEVGVVDAECRGEFFGPALEE